MKRKQNMQIFKLEERVLFDGAAAAEIVAAVNNATAAENADSASDDSEEGKEEKFVQNTVQNAGPVEAPAPEANVQNAGEGIPQADAALNDPAEALIQGNADFTQITDPGAEFSGEMADFIHAADADSVVPQDAAELIVLDSEAADQINPEALDGKNVLILDGDSDVSDQIEDWMEEHSDQKIESIQLVTDSDTLSAEVSDADGVEVVSVQDFQADADAGDDMVIVPDAEANITVEPAAESLPEELTSDAESGRHELVILNSTTADIDSVLEQLGDSRDILIIDSTSDAFEQISDYLEHSDTPYDAVHILTHGNEEGFYLGHQKVTTAEQMAVFDGHLSDHADFMLYGCDLAANEHGQALIHDIADLTGCDVAASTNVTGIAGDWNLEYASGTIETASIRIDNWAHNLATVTLTVDGTTYATLNDALTYAAGQAGDMFIIVLDTDGNHTFAAGGPYDNVENIQITANDTLQITNAVDVELTNGTITVQDGGRLEISGSITVANGITGLSGSDIQLGNGAEIVVTGTASPKGIINGGEMTVSGDVTFTLSNSTTGRAIDNTGTLTVNYAQLTITGARYNIYNSSGSVTSSNVTFSGASSTYYSTGSGSNSLTNTTLRGNIENDGSNFYINGSFNGSGVDEITITNNAVDSIGTPSETGGNIYFGDYDSGGASQGKTISFESTQKYSFVNRGGTMTIYNFTGLSSETAPIRIYNKGVFKIDPNRSDTTTTADLYVRGPSGITAATTGITGYDYGIYNDNISARIAAYHQMVLSDLNIFNTQNNGLGITNLAGTLHLERGSVQGAYAGIANLIYVTVSGGAYPDTLIFRTPYAELNNVEKVAGKAFSVINSGKFIMNNESDALLLTNQLDFTSSYDGSYIAFANRSATYYLRENYVSTSPATNNHWTYYVDTGFQSFEDTNSFSSSSTSSLLQDSLTAKVIASEDLSSKTITFDSYEDTYSLTDPARTYWYYGNYAVVCNTSLSNVAFFAAGTGTTAMQNWGYMSVNNIDNSAYKISDFETILDNGHNAFWVTTSFYHTGAINLSRLTVKADVEMGVDFNASQIKTGSAVAGMTILHGTEVENPAPVMSLEGAPFTIYANQSLSLINISVEGINGSNPLLVEGRLFVGNGTPVTVSDLWADDTSWIDRSRAFFTEETGKSQAYIKADGAVAIANTGTVYLINAAVIDSDVGLSNSGNAYLVNNTFYNNGTGIVNAGTLVVADTTIVSEKDGAVGIRLNSGTLRLANSIVLNKEKGIENNGGTISLDSGNIVDSAEIVNVYGVNYGQLATSGLWSADYKVLALATGSTALTAGGALGYTLSSNGSFTLYVGSTSGASTVVTWDKYGNTRDTEIGSYISTETPTPPTPVTTKYVVTTLADSNDIINPGPDELYSLRFIINRLLDPAQNPEGTDYTVMFDWAKLYAEAGSQNLTISLENTFGSLDLTYTAGTTPIQSLTIDLGASGYVIPSGYTLNIDGSGLSNSVFLISGLSVTIKGMNALTITGAHTDDNGAAFQLANVSGTALTLNHTTVQGGSTTGNGGAVYLAGSNASLTVDAVRFLNNSAAYGGAIYNAGGKVLQAANSTAGTVFRGNTATQGGGAIYNAGGTVTLGTTSAKTTFQGNAAGLEGGAIYVAGGSVSITGNLTGNGEKGTTMTQDGGAIYATGGSVTVTGNLNDNKAAHDGGAIYNGGGKVTVTGDLTGNEAGQDGGAVYNALGSVKVTGNLTDNVATGNGGAIYISGGSVTAIGDLTGNEAAEGSVAYVDGGMVQLGNLANNITLEGNTGSLVVQNAGDVLLMNASITGNNPGADSLFMINAGTFTLLNTTVTGNNGTGILEQGGGLVQIGDSTVYETGAAITVNAGTLNLINSIVNVNNDFTVNKNIQSVVNQEPEDIFTYKNGSPQAGEHGTLKIKASGLAGKGGVMVGYTRNSADGTVLYYTTDGNSWKDVDGNAGSGVTAVEKSQNGATRLFDGYNLLNIGAYSLSSSSLSLVVTNSGDESVEGETTLREALDYAAFLGGNQRITFKVKEVYLNSTITVSSSVNIVGGGVYIYAVNSPDGTAFLGDSVFVLTGGTDVAFRSLTISGMTGVRGIRVDNADLTLKSVTIQNGVADGSVSGSEAYGGAIYVKAGSTVTGSGVTLRDNQAGDGAAIYAVDAPVKLSNFQIVRNIATDTDGSVITSSNTTAPVDGTGLHLLLENGVINSNTAKGALIQAEGDAALISISAANNQMRGPLLQVRSADIVNSSLTGDPKNSSDPLVYAADTLNVANSIIVTSSAGRKAVDAGQIYSAYSIYSGTLQNAAVNVENLTEMGFSSVFTGGLSNGRLMVGDDSPAAVGVWTQYNPATREIAYSVRPQGIWTEQYKPENMQWRYLGGGAAMYNPSLLVGSSDDPSIGAYWITSGRNHPDFGPGVNDGMVNPGYNGGFGSDWGYSSVVNSYLMNPSSSLSDASESGMGWYATLLSELFGFRSQQTGILSVSGGAPGNELGLSVDGSVEGFEEFQEAPYRAEDGTPLSQEEMNAIRTAALTGRMPAESIHLNDAVHEQVASTLRSAEPFKDSFDRALDALLGLDA